jgi:prepilin-type N-terminal cleavage/methylation domain-containing protein
MKINYQKKINSKQGFTLIEVLTGIFILCIMIFGVYEMYNYSLKIVREKGKREQAIAIANEEMEYFRSINYDSLGPYLCEGWAVSDNKTVTRNGINYEVITNIECVNDPFDGEGIDEGEDDYDDTGIGDYKKARVEVRWGQASDYKSIIFVSTFAPIGIETDCIGGILKINVFDANAQPVPQAGVYIKNDNLDPAYEYDTKTNDDGVLRIGCLAQDLGNNYEISINKPGATYYNNIYSTVQTCPTGTGAPNPICPTASPNNVTPTDPHVNIIEGETSEKSFAIDLLTILNIQTITQTLPSEWRVNDAAEDDSMQNKPAIYAGPGGTYYFFWEDDRDAPTRIYGQKFNSSKVAQWTDDVQVSTSNDQSFPDITIDSSGDAYISWYHKSIGNQEVYIDKLLSLDGSSLWGEIFQVISTKQNDDQSDPKINLENDENFLYLTFLDNSNDENDIYAARLSIADGTQEWASETKINDDESGHTQVSPDTIVDSTTNDLYVVWHDNRDSEYDIYAQKIDSDGIYVWGGNIKLNEDGGKEQSYPALAESQEGVDEFIYFVWQDNRNDNFDIYLAKYYKNGTKLWENDINLTTKDMSESDQTRPAIAIDNTNNIIYVAWVDERNGNPDIYLQKFNTSGEAEWTNDLRINDDQSLDSTQGLPKLIINNSNQVVVAWEDNDTGDYDIKAATVTNPDPIDEGNVPLRIYGSKTIGEDIDENNIYKFDETFTTDVNGELKFDGIDQPKLEWDSYTFEINGMGYTLLQTEPPNPFSITPNTANNIIITVE